MVSIPAQYSEACVTLEAIDDGIAEDTESFNITMTTENPLDTVTDSTQVDITSNDGTLKLMNSI